MTRAFFAGAMLAVWALCPAQAQQILLPQDLSPENLDITTLQTEQLPSLRRIEPSRRGLVVQEPVESGARAVDRLLAEFLERRPDMPSCNCFGNRPRLDVFHPATLS